MMDLTDRRSMEILKRMGLAIEVRVHGTFVGCFPLVEERSRILG